MPEQKPLTGDLLGGIGDMAVALFRENTPKTRRRIRGYIDKGLIPAKKVNGRWISRISWIDHAPAFQLEDDAEEDT